VVALASFAASLLLLLAASSVALAGTARRVGAKPTLPAGATPVGAVPQSTPLSVTVTLQPRDPAALAAYAQGVSTPGSSVYRHYLTVSEFARRFGPTPAAIASAEASLQAQGLTPGRLSPNGLSFSVTASAARLGSAFATGFQRYRLRSGRTAYANTSAPQVTGAGASVVQSVIGLNNLAVPQPEGLVRPTLKPKAQAALLPRTTSTSAVSDCLGADAYNAQIASQYGALAYTAQDIASAYGFGSLYSAGDLGSGITVGLYELEPYLPKDITEYKSCYGASTSVTPVLVDGGAGKGAGSGEAALDIEDVIGLVPDASVKVYEGPNDGNGPYDTYAQMIDDRVDVISSSWGMCEQDVGSSYAESENALFEEAATLGETVLAASGDTGVQNCTDQNGNPTGGRSVDDPASQPYVTGVGGTSLSSISPLSETVWNDGYDPQTGTWNGAGGGGVSTFWSMPSYQSGLVPGQSSISCGSAGSACREVPDVSADADQDTGYDVYWNGSWGAIGGTSAATPTWASLIALADGSSGCSASPVGFANPGLYGAARTNYAGNFNDITSGDNAYDGVSGYSALTGYDMASGLGSPKGTALAAALCHSAGDAVTMKTVPSTQSSTAGRAVTPVSVAATSPMGPVTYSASGLPTGLSINSSSGQISGTPTSSGTHIVKVRAVDRDGIVAVGTFIWIVNRPVVTLRAVPKQTGRVHSFKRIVLHAIDGAGASIIWRASGLPAGMKLSSATGKISGRPKKAGIRMVTLTAADRFGGSKSERFKFLVRRH
jgi:subtilase family serine protease